ncbi:MULTISPECIES: NUDIX domain-containing protein [unclassified Streptomyces]|uniref:NUDIX domain-containing protein n=1 Tax=unclassified Streptomyces TaxID=2593676 RepID=UPI00380C7A26
MNAGRHTEPVEVHLILRRDGKEGPEVLLSRRAGSGYAAGLWHVVSGHLNGPEEDVVGALIRESAEEAGVSIDPADVRFAVAVHHRSPAGESRTGMFFEVRTWQGTPGVREPAVCDAMGWFPFNALPEPMVAYCRAGLDAYRSGRLMAVHFQEPGDPIAYTPAVDRCRPFPAVGTGGPDTRALFELHASEAAAPLHHEPGLMGSPALMRMTATAAQLTVPGMRPSGESVSPSTTLEQYAETVPKATLWGCLYFTDEDDRPLQVHSVYSPAYPWQLVGGTTDPGEHPWQTAVRECREEIGITPTGPPRLLATVYSPPGGGWPCSTIGCVFEGGRLTTEQIRGISLDAQEHDEVRVLSMAGWKELMPPGDFARLTAVEEARRTGVAAYIDSWGWGNS